MGAQKQQAQQGFTVIEVMLVLGVTGLMAATLLGGWTVMINTQRYKDSVRATQSFIQEQYNLVYNVQNARENTLRCNNSTVSEVGAGVGQARGQSECVLMGRYLHLDKGEVIRVSAIVGQKPTTEAATSDLTSIQEYNPDISESLLGLSRRELTIPWDAVAVTGAPGSTTPMSAAIAIIRAPSSGIVHTYTANSPSDGGILPLIDLVVAANEQSDLPICLESSAPFSGGRMGVAVKARASAQTYIETIPDGAGAC